MNTKGLSKGQKIVGALLIFWSQMNQYTLTASYAKGAWWNKDDYTIQEGTGAYAGFQSAVYSAFSVVAPLAKLYIQFFFPVMFLFNMFAMALVKDDKAVGFCKNALITECIVALLLWAIPTLITTAFDIWGRVMWFSY